jgi:hypothetical protein
MRGRGVASAAHDILDLIAQISCFKICLDRAIFAEAAVYQEDDVWNVKLSRTSTGRLFLERSELGTWRDHLFLFEMYSGVPPRIGSWRISYKLIREVQVEGDRVTAEFCSDTEKNKVSQIARLVGMVGTGYLLETLSTAEQHADVLKAWDVLHSLSSALADHAQKNGELGTFAGDIRREHLVELISTTLRVPKMRGRKAVDALTFTGPCDDGIWSCPLVPIDQQHLAICHCSIQVNNPMRLLGQLIDNQNLSHRCGDLFEEKCRQQLGACEASRENGPRYVLLDRKHKIFDLIGRKRYPTDFMLQCGSNLLLCEAKSTSHIATEREFFYASEALRKGARQVNARNLRLLENQEKAGKLLGLGASRTSM